MTVTILILEVGEFIVSESSHHLLCILVFVILSEDVRRGSGGDQILP